MTTLQNHRPQREWLDYILKERLKQDAWICLGLGNNVDQEIEWDSETFNTLASRYVKESSGQNGTELPESIGTPEEFFTVLVKLFRQGKGGELPIRNEDFCRFLETHFHCRSTLGGTGARAGRALANLGFRVMVHLNIFSETVQQLLDFPKFYTNIDSQVRPLCQVSGLGQGDYAPHFIVQYNLGDELRIGQTTFVCPQSNRLILPYDHINKVLPIDESYFAHILTQHNQISSMVISGFNAIIDEDLLLERIRQLSQYLSQLRAKTIPIYLEDGGYHIQKYKAHVLRRFGSLVDVFGFNEDELSDILQMNRKSVNMQELHSILEGLEYIAENYNIRNIVLHTKDYALYYGLDKTFDVETGLFFANLLAATRARIGEDAKQEDLQDTLLMPDSQHGITIQQQAQNLILKRHLVVSPAKYIPKPACTIGLGDTFVAGFQICF